MDGLEAQRSTLGDAIVNPALAALRQQLAVLETQATAQPATTIERRMVSILFIDIVGSTSLAEKLDPEEWRQVVEKVHTTLGKAITAHHGLVAQYLGDGLLAFFGAKKASEHDPENAIRASLDGLAAVAELQLSQSVLLRAGVHSGLVVVGDLGEVEHKEFTASGDAVNLAARLQSAAPPGGVLISHDTYRYVRGVFDVTRQPLITLKGKSEPVQTYLVRRAKPRPFRSLARGVAGVETRTIGREEEIKTLQEAYLWAYKQHGTVWAQLIGDPGVGKSRLVSDISDWLELREETTRLLRARAFPDDARQPFALIRRMWFDRFQIADDIPLQQAEKKWVERYQEFCGVEACEEAAHALGLLVGLPFQDSPYIGAMRNDPNQVKGRALVVSRELIEAVRRNDPVVVLLEDLHWTDAASWEYLMEVFFGDSTEEKQNGVFILGAARPEWHPPEKLATLLTSSSPSAKRPEKWGAQISLALLTDEETRELAKELLQRATDVPTELIDLIVQRSEGVPYFAEEIVNWFVDRGILDTRSEPWRFFPEKLKDEPLPATLQHLLLTRLSSLTEPERTVLQRGAIFGRRFWTGGVEALGVPTGGEMLGHLQPRGFVEAQPESAFQGDTEWSFHHNLLQEVTYESVLKRERSTLHRDAADWLEQQARRAGRLDEFAGLLGEHYERAGELSAAADWYLRAGQRAMGQGAPIEAKNYFTQALELLPPVDRERRWQALTGRENAYSVLGEAELESADINALLELAHTIGDDNYLAEANYRQALFGTRSSQNRIVVSATQKALEAAQRCVNEPLEIRAAALKAQNELFLGDKSVGLQGLEDALDRARHLGDESLLADVLFRAAFCFSELGDLVRTYHLQLEQIELDHRLGNRGQEVIGLGNIGSTYQTLGLYKQARTALEQARGIAEAMGASRPMAYSLMNLGELYRATGDLRKAKLCAEQSLQVIAKSEDARGKTFAVLVLGYTLLAERDYHSAAKRFQEGQELALSNGLSPLAHECIGGLAASMAMEGELDKAREYNLEVRNYLQEHGWVGMGSPGRVIYTCAETFDILGEVDLYWEVVERGRKELMDVAEKIHEPAWRQSFLENVPEHRAIIEMWERGKP